jgi:hypothetical protein
MIKKKMKIENKRREKREKKLYPPYGKKHGPRTSLHISGNHFKLPQSSETKDIIQSTLQK